MDFPTQKKHIPNPFKSANLFSFLFFSWVTPLLKQGSRKTLSLDDLYNILDDHQASLLGDQLEREWNRMSVDDASVSQSGEEKSNSTHIRKFKLLRVLGSIHWKQFTLLTLCMVVDEWVIRILQPIFVRSFISSFSNDDFSINRRQNQYIYGIALCLITLAHVEMMHLSYHYLFIIGMKCRIAVSSLIYKKVLRLNKNIPQQTNNNNNKQTNLGQLMNLLSTDVSFDFNLALIGYVIIGPVQCCILSYLLWIEFGNSAFAGVACILIISPIQYILNIYGAKLTEEVAKRTDTRANTMSELVAGMKIIKMYAWEIPYIKLIYKLRGKEIDTIRCKSIFRGCAAALFNFSSKIVLFFIILTFVLNGHDLTADKVFFAATICGTMIVVMLLIVPNSITSFVEILVRCKRIQTMLEAPEQKNQAESQFTLNLFNSHNGNGNGKNLRMVEKLESSGLEMKNISASWTTEKVTLQDININLKPNQLVMIIGAVGSGKTSLLNILLNELPITTGKFNLNGNSISYSSQEPWLFPGTMRQNIIYDQIYDEAHYKKILHACALEHDLAQFPAGDLSRIGDSRLVLSGGQKMRISISRSMYRNADLYLFDDPLSSVDTRVGQHIFENCFLNLLHGKLRILVTHQLQYLSKADYVIILEQGKILTQGQYEELDAHDDNFKRYLESNKQKENFEKSALVVEESKNCKSFSMKEIEDGAEGNKEKMLEGTISSKTYWAYFRNGGSPCLILILLFGFLISQVLYTFSDAWLSHWINAQTEKSKQFNNQSHPDRIELTSTQIYNSTINTQSSNTFNIQLNLQDHEYFIIYSSIIGSMMAAFLLTAVSFFYYSMKIGVNLHDKVFKSLIRTRIQFFEMNPAGRILNRFTKDLNGIDEFLPITIYEITQIFFQSICTLLIVVLANYFMVIPTFISFIFMCLLRQFFIKSARNFKRLEATARSPLFVHLNATYNGLATIRALKSESRLIDEFHAHQDIHTCTWFAYLSCTRWFGLWLEFITVFYLICGVISFLFFSTSISAGNVGLAISSILLLNGSFQWGMRQSVEITNLMVSVERIFEYCSIEPEAPLESKLESKPPIDWPSNGEIQFDSVSLNFNNSPVNVLHNLNFQIQGGERIGICGRTGAGKTSLISTLFRMAEITGNIYIDNICIGEIGLHDLRKKISIIPQDPILFSGTIRYNLDPFEEFDDTELWQVLDEVELKEEVSSLDFEITESGNNFSVGQKQLICLARAILRNNKIIVLDEATANIDLRTDQLIQNTIAKKFSHCTMLIVAHRLHTIMDCDRILVLENGCILEYDSPQVLLKNPNGYFKTMALQAGILI